MPTPLPSLFSKFQLSDEETLFGLELTTIQEAFIQNMICTAVETRIGLDFSEEYLKDSLKKEAALQGEIRALSWLITVSDLSRKAKVVDATR
jgi:hypothetical protein